MAIEKAICREFEQSPAIVDDYINTECYIPNKEVRIEMTNAVEAAGWKLELTM